MARPTAWRKRARSRNAGFDTILLHSAQSLATRFNPIVGAIRSWDNAPWHFPVIIDNMMNLELLFRATHLSGDSFILPDRRYARQYDPAQPFPT